MLYLKSFFAFVEHREVAALPHLDYAGDSKSIDYLCAFFFHGEQADVEEQGKVFGGHGFIELEMSGQVTDTPGSGRELFQHSQPVRMADSLEKLRCHDQPFRIRIIHGPIVANLGNLVKFFGRMLSSS